MARMRFGVQLHPDRGADAVLREARVADEHGFDSVWTGDHRAEEPVEELASWGVSYVRLNFADEAALSTFDFASKSISDRALTSSGVKPGATSSSTKPPA